MYARHNDAQRSVRAYGTITLVVPRPFHEVDTAARRDSTRRCRLHHRRRLVIVARNRFRDRPGRRRAWLFFARFTPPRKTKQWLFRDVVTTRRMTHDDMLRRFGRPEVFSRRAVSSFSNSLLLFELRFNREKRNARESNARTQCRKNDKLAMLTNRTSNHHQNLFEIKETDFCFNLNLLFLYIFMPFTRNA